MKAITVNREKTKNESMKKCFNYFDFLFFTKNTGIEFWIAGGALRDFFSNKKISDFDCFFPDEKNLEKMKKNLLDSNFKIVFENQNCIKMKSKKNMYIDLVKNFFNSPKKTINKFDFTVSCCAISNGKLIYEENFFINLASRSLVINSLPRPISTFRRLQKYHKKGFTICNMGISKISRAINKTDMENPKQNEIEFYGDGRVKILSFD